MPTRNILDIENLTRSGRQTGLQAHDDAPQALTTGFVLSSVLRERDKGHFTDYRVNRDVGPQYPNSRQPPLPPK